MSLESLAADIRENVSLFPKVYPRFILFRKGTYTKLTVDTITDLLAIHGFELTKRYIPNYPTEPRIDYGDGYYYVDRCPEPAYAHPWASWYPDFKLHIAAIPESDYSI